MNSNWLPKPEPGIATVSQEPEYVQHPLEKGEIKTGSKITRELRQFAIKLALWAIRAYQLLISPLFPSCCRFAPTCSHYASEALARHGFRRGLYLSLRRLLRCHPFHPGGWDPVP